MASGNCDVRSTQAETLKRDMDDEYEIRRRCVSTASTNSLNSLKQIERKKVALNAMEDLMGLDAPRGPSLAADLIERAGEARARIDRATGRLRDIADNALGFAPEEERPCNACSAPPGRLHALQDILSDLHGDLSDLERQIDRLEQL